MHFLAKISIPNQAGNKFVSGTDFNQKMDSLMAILKPETAYFSVANGQRTIFAFIEVQESHEITTKIEPFWLALSADVELLPTMSQKEFAKAMPGLKQSVERFSHPLETRPLESSQN